MQTVPSRDGTKIAYTRSGAGPVVVLVGGALQHKSDHLMGRLAPLLAQHFTVVSYDRRGRGDSGDTQPFAVEREIQDLKAVIGAAGGAACVFGNSSGGTLVLLAAATLQGITKLAVYEVPCIPEEQIGSAAEYKDQLRKFIAAGQRGKAVKLFLKRIGVPAAATVLAPLLPMWRQMKAVAPTLAYDAEIVGDGAVPKQVNKIAAPTLVLSGGSARMKQAADAAAAALPAARRKVLEGQTHDVKPDVLASALIEFFESSR